MEDALRASIGGLDQVDQARKRKGWNRQSAAWAEVALTSIASLKQFWRRERIQRETFTRICAAVGIVDWQAIAESVDDQSSESPNLQTAVPEAVTSQQRVDWGEAPEISFFCGREVELKTLAGWIESDSSESTGPQRAKLVTLLGMGGMGKTTLAVRLAEQLAPQFEAVVWRSLRNAPPLESLVTDLLRVLLRHPPVAPIEPLAQQLSRLLTCLRDRRCLIVLDNAESILAGGTASIGGHYRAGHEAYGELLRRVGEERHQSCLLITSREQPKEVALLEGDKVRSLRLRGLLPAEGQQLLEQIGDVSGSASECGAIVEHYAGNPLALKIVAVGIRDLLSNRIQDFLTLLHEGSFAFSDIQDLLERHFTRLSHAEQEVLIWLAIAREPVVLDELKQDLLSPESRWKVAETLESLKRRSLLEITPTGFTLQPAVMEYVTEHLITSVCGEIMAAIGSSAAETTLTPLVTFRNHALVKATAQDYIRAAQTRLILEPVLDRLLAICDTPDRMKPFLTELLPRFQRKPAIKTGYIGGNLLNLLGHLQVDLSGYDFSHLTLWQADLRRVLLQYANLSHADLRRSVFTETFSTVLSVAFSPDGRSLAKCDDRGGVSIREIETGHQVQAFRAHANWVFALAYSPDGTTIATGGLDRSVKLWNVATGACLQNLQFHTGSVSTLAFSPDAQSGLLASGSADHTIQLLNWQTGTCRQTLSGHTGIVRAIAFSPDGQWLASVSLDRTLKLWDVHQGTCCRTIQDTAPIYAVAFVDSPPHRLITAGDDGAIKQWDLTSGECLQTLEGHRDRVWSLAVDLTSQWLVSAGDDRTIKLWDLATGHCIRTLPGHQNRIWSVAISPDGATIASGSDDRTVRLWSLPAGHCLRTLQGYHNRTSPIAFVTPNPSQPDSTWQLVTFSADQTVRFWDYPTGVCRQVMPLPTRGAMQAAFSVQSKSSTRSSGLLASGSLDHTIHLCEVGGDCLRSLHGHTTWVRSVVFSPDGTQLASASGDQTVKLWDLTTGNCLHTLVGHTNPVQSVAFHPSGTWLASGSWDQTVKLWDLLTGNCVQTLVGHGDQIREIAFTIDGKQLISSSQDHTIRGWDWRSGRCLQVLAVHTADVEAIAVSPDGNHLASASLDGTLRLWQLATGTCVRVFSHTIDGCGSLVFSADGQLLASGSEDGTATVWDVKTGETITLFQVPRPYEGMNITAVTGLTAAQTIALQSLGAIRDDL